MALNGCSSGSGCDPNCTGGTGVSVGSPSHYFRSDITTSGFKYGGTGQVHLCLISLPERLLVEVWDTGEDLAPDDVDRLFEQF